MKHGCARQETSKIKTENHYVDLFQTSFQN